MCVIGRSRTASAIWVTSTREAVRPLFLSSILANTRADLRHLGQSTRQSKSTLAQVRAKIAALREQTAEKEKAKKIDFDARLRNIRAAEAASRKERKEAKRKAKEAEAEPMEVDQDMASMMGFSGFAATAGR